MGIYDSSFQYSHDETTPEQTSDSISNDDDDDAGYEISWEFGEELTVSGPDPDKLTDIYLAITDNDQF